MSVNVYTYRKMQINSSLHGSIDVFAYTIADGENKVTTSIDTIYFFRIPLLIFALVSISFYLSCGYCTA